MNTTDTTTNDRSADPTHLYVLLDRSGSMEAIKAEVVEGLNGFILGQQRAAPTPDSRSSSSTPRTRPRRSSTTSRSTGCARSPGTTSSHAAGRRCSTPPASSSARPGCAPTSGPPRATEDVVVVTVTDGQENSSREMTRERLRALVAERESAGWTFVYLSAGLDAYADAQAYGYAEGSIQSFAPDAEGAGLAFASLDVAIGTLRHRKRVGAPVPAAEVWQGDKPAEADRRAKRGDTR